MAWNTFGALLTVMTSKYFLMTAVSTVCSHVEGKADTCGQISLIIHVSQFLPPLYLWKCKHDDKSDTFIFEWQQNACQKLLLLQSWKLYIACWIILLQRSNHDYAGGETKLHDLMYLKWTLEYKKYLSQMFELAGGLSWALA